MKSLLAELNMRYFNSANGLIKYLIKYLAYNKNSIMFAII